MRAYGATITFWACVLAAGSSPLGATEGGDSRVEPHAPRVAPAFVKRASGGSVVEDARLFGRRSGPGSDGEAEDYFGNQVALLGETAFVGAFWDDVGGVVNQGSVYVFSRVGDSWREDAKLTAPDGAEGDRFGWSIAAAGDTLVVGVAPDDGSAGADQGSAYVFVREAGRWVMQAKLFAADAASGDRFGAAVAVDGDTAVIGAFLDDVGQAENQGSAYVFQRNGATWVQHAKLTAADGAAFDAFGSSVAISGGSVLVGASNAAVGNAGQQGAAYVFQRDGAAWVQRSRLLASDGAANDFFGSSVALAGDTAVVGAVGSDVGAAGNEGAAYVFSRTGTDWAQRSKLTAAPGATGDTRFGFAIALSGGAILVGAPGSGFAAGPGLGGAAYVFFQNGMEWERGARLAAAQTGVAGLFGAAVALDASTALVGNQSATLEPNADQGSAYVFTGAAATWNPQAQLSSGDGSGGSWFGRSVVVDGNTAIVGAPLEGPEGARPAGAAYVFERELSGWVMQARLVAPDGAPFDLFGWSVALDGDTAVIGARTDDVGLAERRGSAYVFVRDGSTWTLQAKLLATDGGTFHYFGESVSIDGNRVLVGAFGADDFRGSAYVFERMGTAWSQVAKLAAFDSSLLGVAVALAGDVAIVGAPRSATGSMQSGSVYVFARSGTAWPFQARIAAPDGAEGDEFGAAVGFDGSTLLVGVPGDDIGPNVDQGSAHVFVRSGPTWTQSARLTARDALPGDRFGGAVAVGGNIALVGASSADVGARADQGLAHAFVRLGGVWQPRSALAASDGIAKDAFGVSVALGSDTAIVGSLASGAAPHGNPAEGAAYLFAGVELMFGDGFEPQGTQPPPQP